MVQKEIAGGRVLHYLPNNLQRAARKFEIRLITEKSDELGLIPFFCLGVGKGRGASRCIYTALLHRLSGGKLIQADIRNFFGSSSRQSAHKILKKNKMDFAELNKIFIGNKIFRNGFAQGETGSPLFSCFSNRAFFYELQNEYDLHIYVDDITIYSKPNQTLENFKYNFEKAAKQLSPNITLSKKPHKKVREIACKDSTEILGVKLLAEKPWLFPTHGKPNFFFLQTLQTVRQEAEIDHRALSDPHKSLIKRTFDTILTFSTPSNDDSGRNSDRQASTLMPSNLIKEQMIVTLLTTLFESNTQATTSQRNGSNLFGIYRETSLSIIFRLILTHEQGELIYQVDNNEIQETINDEQGGCVGHLLSFPPIQRNLSAFSKTLSIELRKNNAPANHFYQEFLKAPFGNKKIEVCQYAEEKMPILLLLQNELWTTFIKFTPIFTFTVLFINYKKPLLLKYERLAAFFLLRSELGLINSLTKELFSGFFIPEKKIKQLLRSFLLKKYFQLLYPSIRLPDKFWNLIATIVWPHVVIGTLAKLAKDFSEKRLSFKDLEKQIAQLRSKLQREAFLSESKK